MPELFSLLEEEIRFNEFSAATIRLLFCFFPFGIDRTVEYTHSQPSVINPTIVVYLDLLFCCSTVVVVVGWACLKQHMAH